MSFTLGKLRVFHQRSGISAYSTSIFSALYAFPEMKEATTLEQKGHFAQALGPVERIREIATKTLGKDNDITNAAALKLMQLYRLNGDTEKAVALGRSSPYYNQKLGVTNTKFKLHILHEMSRIFINNCDMTSSLSCTESSIKILESQDKENCDVSLFSAAYGLKGISSLFLGRYQDAEDYLQFASRWSNTTNDELGPVEADIEMKARQLVGLSNLALFHWYCTASLYTSPTEYISHHNQNKGTPWPWNVY